MEPTQITAKPSRSIVARVLAPLALVVVAIVVIVVVSNTLDETNSGGGDEGRGENPPARSQPREQGPATYVVQPGDTLLTIAEETGVSVDRLLDLNPGIDPQALPSGAELNLR
jgi:LysM repeat protein